MTEHFPYELRLPLAPYRFERVYGAWWRRVVYTDGAAAVARSAERYLRFALGEGNPSA